MSARRVPINATALVFEAFVLLAETPLYHGLWTHHHLPSSSLYNSRCLGHGRILLPKIPEPPGARPFVAMLKDGWAAKK